MSLDFYLNKKIETAVFSMNITHNLTEMAHACGLYHALWRPDEMPGVKLAGDLISHLKHGIAELSTNPDKYKKFNPENGWGNYEGLLEVAIETLAACEKHPDATIEVSR